MSDVQPFSPRALLLAGHHATWSGAYFQRVLEVARLARDPEDPAAAYRDALVAALKEEQAAVVPMIRLAHALGQAHGVDLGTAPGVPGDWEAWAGRLARGFQERLDPKVPDHHAFGWGWELGQLRATLALIATLAEVHTAGADRRMRISQGVVTLKQIGARWPHPMRAIATTPWGAAAKPAWQAVSDEVARVAASDAGAAHDDALGDLGRDAQRLLAATHQLAAAADATFPAEPADA